MSNTRIRCAIYTRKSSDEGLDQDFNSLDAQHEACAAYIASQKHEGWKLLPARYDDGGVSGGTLERPALRRLMADIDAGRIDMVVVYKIDRLTRSLVDFAKLVEHLEAASCSFVSVTQAFNTSSSMGRLTLNVLLSFAQFEREVTAERIRDKIAASKKKGLWMGGLAPLGYDPHPDRTRRELVVNEAEAQVVHQLFELYLAQGCLNATAREAARLGLRSKHRVFASGREQGGGPFSRGQIHKILTNPVYRGMIRHKDKTFPGTHPAIIDEDLWNRVQARLESASTRRRRGRTPGATKSPTPLKGLFRDETGDLLTPTHTTRGARRHRYYVSHRLIAGGADPAGWRLPAAAFEAAVARIVADHLEVCASRHAVVVTDDTAGAMRVTALARTLVATIRSEGIGTAVGFIATGHIARGAIEVGLEPKSLGQALGYAAGTLNPDLLSISAPFTCRRRGAEMRIIAGETKPKPDATLIRTLANAHRWAATLRSGTPLGEIARREGHSESYIRTRAPLAFLAPKIQVAILEGTLPPEITTKRLIARPLPLDWGEQERLVGM
ncbi:recombinase family protein [Marimonas arenosa]|uniref:Recombinase family protein n=1 Tax=Marimonas arenosa TaxID=1795305 RepID=A0AAE4B376_9RHOB|nr:recombinase family protein [Marimonas arenosa]MDQ2088985.1 recombinase family protein [Marimonas arenosa]